MCATQRKKGHHLLAAKIQIIASASTPWVTVFIYAGCTYNPPALLRCDRNPIGQGNTISAHRLLHILCLSLWPCTSLGLRYWFMESRCARDVCGAQTIGVVYGYMQLVNLLTWKLFEHFRPSTKRCSHQYSTVNNVLLCWLACHNFLSQTGILPIWNSLSFISGLVSNVMPLGLRGRT